MDNGAIVFALFLLPLWCVIGVGLIGALAVAVIGINALLSMAIARIIASRRTRRGG